MTVRSKALQRTQRVFMHMTPSHVVKARLTKRTIADFAEKVGLVYFGYVNQRDDDHKLVRGHTVSSSHIDNHYCVGSLRGYDVSMVSREDVVQTHTRKNQRYHWLICTFDLHTRMDVPHLYVGHRNREEAFRASYEQLHAIDMSTYATYPKDFTRDYVVYGIPGESIEIQQTITPQVAEVISRHFQQASIEIEDNTVYLYIESQHPSGVLLEKMLSNGLWLAEAVDAAYTAQVQSAD